SMEAGSHYAPMGLREMKSKRAVPKLKETLAKSTDDLKIFVAIALNVIEETEEYIPHIIEVLVNCRSPYTRLVAARELRRYNSPESIEALYNAVRDPDYLVRNHTSESLLSIHGLEPSISEYDEIFTHICYSMENVGATLEECRNQYDLAAGMLTSPFKINKQENKDS
ncbi:MAG: HEAT repeat domain-containing protein, partial [Candidatus Thorarchaeota archaeon]